MTIRRHKRRYWRLEEDDGTLVCVTVFKKGAAEVARRLSGPRELLEMAAHVSRHPWEAGGPATKGETMTGTKKKDETAKKGGR